MGPIRFTELGPEHGSDLAEFECRVFRHPWTDAIEYMVRELLPAALSSGAVHAIGCWDEDDLCGVVAYRPEPEFADAWRVPVLAVRLGWMRQGIGMGLKRALLRRAAAEGVRLVISSIDRDNEPMVRINSALGAAIEPDPETRDHLLCVIPLPAKSR